MKNLLFVIFMAFSIICRAQTSQFEKPRYLKHATFVCPIDMTKSYSKEGIIKGNPFSIGTAYSKTVSKDTIVVNSGNKTVETRKVIDTVLIKTILIEKGWAFDVVQQIGSFSIIKFWNFSHRFKSGYSKKEPLPNKDFGVKKIKGMTAIIDDDVYDLSQSFYIVPTTTIEHNSIEFESKKNLSLLTHT